MQQITTIAALRDFTPITSETRFKRHMWTLGKIEINDDLDDAERDAWIDDLAREMTYDVGCDVIYDDGGEIYFVKKNRIAVIPCVLGKRNFVFGKES